MVKSQNHLVFDKVVSYHERSWVTYIEVYWKEINYICLCSHIVFNTEGIQKPQVREGRTNAVIVFKTQEILKPQVREG